MAEITRKRWLGEKYAGQILFHAYSQAHERREKKRETIREPENHISVKKINVRMPYSTTNYVEPLLQRLNAASMAQRLRVQVAKFGCGKHTISNRLVISTHTSPVEET